MLRTLIAVGILCIIVWAPWMDTRGSEELSREVFDVFGPVPSACYDSDGELLQEGLVVRWYPMGRLVHTCRGDYVVWFWGAVKELGGVYKPSGTLRAVQGRPLTCGEVVERQDARRASSSDERITYYEGPYATEPDFSIFDEARSQRTLITRALAGGPNFAGEFVVAEWACGPNCRTFAVAHARTGLVVAYGPETEYGISYAYDSTLLVTNPVENLPELPRSSYETESVALSIARLPRAYYQLTTDTLSETQYLVRVCVESAAAGYIEVEDDRLGVIGDDEQE